MMLLETAWRDKTVCITGGAGFIGHHITQALARLQTNIIIYDDFSTGDLTRIQKIAALYPRINIVSGCITQLDGWATQTDIRVDHIIHLAAVSSVSHGASDPDRCFFTNIQGTYATLAAAQYWKCSVAFASSAAVYGPQKEPCHESMIPQPQSWYARSKLIGELLCQQASTQAIPTLCLRYFNVVGPGQPHTGPSAGVTSIWRHCIAQGDPIILQGDGQQVRDFVPVNSIIQANLLLPCMPREQQYGQPINICTGKGTRLIDLIDELAKQEGVLDYQIEYAPVRPHDISVSVGDCSKYQNVVKSLQQKSFF
jgi:UDP-glucose 4-epimerase